MLAIRHRFGNEARSRIPCARG